MFHTKKQDFTHSCDNRFTIMMTSATVNENPFAKCVKSRSGIAHIPNRQTISQADVCGDGIRALDINCQNL
jgi:hypothetical protein